MHVSGTCLSSSHIASSLRARAKSDIDPQFHHTAQGVSRSRHSVEVVKMKLSSQVVLYTSQSQGQHSLCTSHARPFPWPQIKFYLPPGNLLCIVLPISGWEAWAFSWVGLSGMDMLLSYLLSSCCPLDTNPVRSSGISDLIWS